MPNDIEPLILDLVEWVAKQPRPYADVLDAWRTSCPRLPIWEEAVERSYVARMPVEGARGTVTVTAAGLAFLAAHGRRMARPAGETDTAHGDRAA